MLANDFQISGFNNMIIAGICLEPHIVWLYAICPTGHHYKLSLAFSIIAIGTLKWY